MPPPAAPAGDPAPADEVGEEAEDLFGAGFYHDIDEEHHDDTDGERTDEEFEIPDPCCTQTPSMEVGVKIVDQKTALMTRAATAPRRLLK